MRCRPIDLDRDARSPAGNPTAWVAVVGLILISTGCTLSPVVVAPNTTDFGTAARHTAATRATEQARAAQAENDHYHALQHWLVVDALDRGNLPAQQAIAELRATISEQTGGLIALALDAKAKGSLTKSRRYLLQALAIDPANNDILQMLTEQQLAGALAALRQTPERVATEPSYFESPNQVPLASGGDPAQMAMSIFAQAMRVVDQRPDDAAALFSKVLEHDPTHLAARVMLESLKAKQP